MPRSLDQLEALIEQALSKKAFEDALTSIQRIVQTIIACPLNTAFLFSAPRLDALCQTIGREICKEYGLLRETEPPISDRAAYVVTDLYLSGGHTAVIEECILLQPDKEHRILITDIQGISNREAIRSRFNHLPVRLIWPPHRRLSDTVIWLIDELSQYRPDRIFLLQHHMDSTAIAALQPSLRSSVLFYHHGDHHLCLGVHVPHFIHVDPSPMGFHHCREKLGIDHNLYWPLSAVDRGTRAPEWPYMEGGRLKTCSSGSAMKFESPYLYPYATYIPKLLQETDATHLHIGPLSETTLRNIDAGMQKYGVTKSRFIHLPWVKSVWETLLRERIDLYITSFPFGGGKACIEAMGSGTPTVIHRSYRSRFYDGECLLYPEGFRWAQPEELIAHIRQLTPDHLQMQSRLARTHYERNHLPETFQAELAKKPSEMRGHTPPPCPDFQNNPFQIALEQALTYGPETRDLKIQLDTLLNSTSWKLTQPLRSIKDAYIQLCQRVKSK